ncbi:MAG: DNA primase large subunit PriL [Aigarchaeota archaeon]|nr:DNA primase large subunit PriL [Aigarchaeota archaeon]
METARKLPILAKYPFLPESREYLAKYGLAIESFEDPAYSRIIERAKTRILDAANYGDNVGPWNVSDDELVELASFPLSVLMLALIGDKRLARRFALAESSLAVKFLEEEDEEVVLKIAREIFGMDVRIEKKMIGGIEYDYSLGLKDYLRGALLFNKPEWKLVNRIVERGRVLVTSHELIRLMKDRIMDHVLNLVDRSWGKPVKLPRPLEDALEEIRGKLPSGMVEFEVSSELGGPETWPPCMKILREKLLAGENLSHFANFALASFLINIGVNPEEVLGLYANRPDFDARVARYQVEHIAGLKGSRTKYTTPNCGTMRTNGLCVKNGELCGGVKNPLTYYRRAVRRRLKLDKDKAEVGGERGEAGGEAMRGDGGEGGDTYPEGASNNNR